MIEQLGDSEANVLRDLPQQGWCDITSGMERHSSATATFIPKLLVRTSLAYFNEAKPFQNGHDLRGLQDRDIAHTSRDSDVLNTDKF